MIRTSCGSCDATQLPLQSTCADAPTGFAPAVPVKIASRFVTGSTTIGNALLAAIGALRTHDAGTATPEVCGWFPPAGLMHQLSCRSGVSTEFSAVESSPAIAIARSPIWCGSTVVVPNDPKMFPATYTLGGPHSSRLFAVK